MGFLDKAKQAADTARERAAQLASERSGQIRGGIDKASGAVDARTGGKYRQQIAKARTGVSGRLDDLAREHENRTRTGPVHEQAHVVGDAELDEQMSGPQGNLSHTEAPGGPTPGVPRPEGETPGGPAPGSSR